MKKICFIHTPVPELRDDRLDPPMGLLALASWLKAKTAYDVSVLDLSGYRPEEWEALIPESEFYGFSTYTASYYRTLQIKDIAKKISPKAVTIAGGPHATALPEEVANDFDYVVVGDGEIAIEQILDASISKKIVYNEPILDADLLPFIDYSLVDIHTYHRKVGGLKRLPIFTSRGCPYNCAFCSSKADKYGRFLRQRSVNHFVSEIKDIQNKYGDIAFRIKDDCFGINTKWIKDFMVHSPKITYDCLLRADFKPHIPYFLKLSGCDMVSLGIESGSDVILENMNKGITTRQNALAIISLKQCGLKTLCWIIVGFPGETWDTVKDTVHMLNETAPDMYTVYPLIPYPGTDVYKNRDKYGIRIIDQCYSNFFYIYGDYDAGYVYETDTLSPSLIKEMKQYIIENVTESVLR